MSRLIDADALYEKTANWEAQALHMVEVTMYDEDKMEEWRKWSAVLTERSAFKHDIADAPIIDAVEVVRCKECKFQAKCPTKIFGNHSDDWFCGDGKRRDEHDAAICD